MYKYTHTIIKKIKKLWIEYVDFWDVIKEPNLRTMCIGRKER